MKIREEGKRHHGVRPYLLALLCFAFSMIIPITLPAAELIHHSIKATLSPEDHRISVVDSITLPESSPRQVRFTLHSGLRPSSTTSGVEVVKQGERQDAVPLESYSITLPPNRNAFTMKYEGSIYHPVSRSGREQARGFEDTPGVISPDGVFLSGSSGWYPDFGYPLMTFDLDVKLPPSWDAVSQGARIEHDRGRKKASVVWRSPEPQDSLYLVAAQFTEYVKTAGPVDAMVFLRSPDRNLADQYLDATVRYIEMYDRLIGPYPYRKFALVENFWETGFGMPSFTLLGPRVIRLPFIINTSYPHEILHNWWGNSVYPDYEKGNWSEGITAYLADYLLREQQGGGVEYRISTLQKYADYVRGSRDFPLSQFRSRHSPSTEAVGYGKALMFFHMLRVELGDDVFRKGLREFYRRYKFHFASFDDIRRTFESVSGKDLRQEFEQWVMRTGAPQLTVGKSSVVPDPPGFLVTAQLEQVQPGEAYHLRVPVAVTVEGEPRAFQTTADMTGKQFELKLRVPAMPLRLDIDPEFDVFRRLDRDEIPPAISQALGAKKMLVVLPSGADPALLTAYREFSQALARSGPDEVEVKLDREIKELPSDRAVTIIGWKNRFVSDVYEALFGYDVSIKDQTVRIDRTSIPREGHSFVLTARLPRNRDMALSLVATDLPAALPGLARKLPHYHKYSYLAFEGVEPVNVAKGRWPVVDSPLTIFLPGRNGTIRKAGMAELAPRETLTSLDSVFSKERMMNVIRFLASNELGGRGFGTPGLDKAADYLSKEFREAGLAPAADEGNGFLQVWEETVDPNHRATLKNVVGVIPGANPELASQSVVVGAHYDHLGLGWPETRDKSQGKVHPGADDNASGVAILLELARVLAKGPKLDRSIVFVAFSGEEEGRLGSRYYVQREKQYPAAQCIGMVNMDTVGRLGRNKLLVLGASSAKEWVHIFRGAGHTTGVDIETVTTELDSSDQKSFQDAGVPAVQLFSGTNLDYHRSTDTPDKIDADGLVKVASVAREAVDYLAERKGPLTAGPKPESASDSQPTGERKVSLGTIPDFAFTGKGVRTTGVVAGSPAEAAGLKDGDIIVQLNGSPVENLKSFSDILKTLKPGDKATIVFLRDGKENTVQTEVKER
jgi:aminopeptidase N